MKKTGVLFLILAALFFAGCEGGFTDPNHGGDDREENHDAAAAVLTITDTAFG